MTSSLFVTDVINLAESLMTTKLLVNEYQLSINNYYGPPRGI